MGDTHGEGELSQQVDVPGMIPKKTRIGARGRRKVKTGCRTCKIRHKKCDEVKPACTPCNSTGRRCDFSEASQQGTGTLHADAVPGPNGQTLRLELIRTPSSLPDHMFALTSFEASHLDYFLHVCTQDFSLYFENPRWEWVLVQAVHSEKCIYHAVLAVSVLSRKNYFPAQDWHDPDRTGSAFEYSMMQYNRAIQGLNARLGGEVGSMKLAILASIPFANIEGFQGYGMRMNVHLRGGLRLLRRLQAFTRDTRCLETALFQIRDQVEEFSGEKIGEEG